MHKLDNYSRFEVNGAAKEELRDLAMLWLMYIHEKRLKEKYRRAYIRRLQYFTYEYERRCKIIPRFVYLLLILKNAT